MNKELLKDLKVLIVEDEVKLAKLLKDALRGYFYNISHANNGEEGIAKFHTVKPDIIITDIMMPKMDGLEMSKKINEINESVPIIVLSAFSEKEKLLKAIDVGITKYFIKPFDPDELITYLNDLALKLHKNRVITLCDHFSFDNSSMSLYQNKKLISLTKREKEFIYLLCQNLNTVVKKEAIKKALWENETISEERLRTFVKRLRIKTSKALIDNASGQGYLISVKHL